MKFAIVDVEQRTEEWLQARCGLITGSRASAILAKIRSGEAAARRDYRLELVCERLTGRPQEGGFVSADMQHGIDTEPAARAAYEALTGSLVEEVGFIRHATVLAGCSPDGQVDNFAGLVEFKCPKSATHLGYLQNPNRLPPRYVPQVTHNLWVTGAEWCDFVSFDDRFPVELQLFVVRVQSVALDIAGYEAEARQFLYEVDDDTRTVEALRHASLDNPVIVSPVTDV